MSNNNKIIFRRVKFWEKARVFLLKIKTKTASERGCVYLCVCVCVYVRERECGFMYYLLSYLWIGVFLFSHFLITSSNISYRNLFYSLSLSLSLSLWAQSRLGQGQFSWVRLGVFWGQSRAPARTHGGPAPKRAPNLSLT